MILLLAMGCSRVESDKNENSNTIEEVEDSTNNEVIKDVAVNREVYVEIKDTDITKDKKEIVYLIDNQSKDTYYYDAIVTLEKYEGTTWKTVDTKEEVAVIAIAYILDPGMTNEHTFSLGFYEELGAGNYRIVKKFTKDSSEEVESIVLYGDFEIK